MIKRTIFHFLRGYLALLLALLLFLLPLYYGMISLFEKRQLDITAESMRNGLSSLDQQIFALNGLVFAIGRNVEWRALSRRPADSFKPSDYYGLSLLHEEFRRQCLAYSLIRDYGLLMQNRVLFTKERVHIPTEEYYDKYLSFGDIDEEGFYKTFNEPGASSRFLPALTVRTRGGDDEAAARYDALIWLCSMSMVYTSSPMGAFYAAIAEDTLAELIMLGLEPDEAGFTLTDEKGVELMRYGLANEVPDDARTLAATAAQSRLTATLYLSNKLFTGMMSPVYSMMIWAIALLTLGGLVIATCLSIRTSRPIRRLVHLIGSSENAADYSGGASNSFDMIGNAVTGLSSSVEEYRRALAAQQTSVRERVFDDMLRAAPDKSATSARRIHEFSHCFPQFPRRYRLAVMQIADDAEHDVDTLPQRQMTLRGVIEAAVSPTPYAHMLGHRAIAVLDAARCENYVPALTDVKTLARDKFGLAVHVALSDEGHSCEQLHALYNQACGVLRLARGEGPESPVEIWQRRNFPDQSGRFPLDYTEMAQLHALLTHAEKEAALGMIDDIRAQLKGVTLLDEVVVCQVFYNLRSVLLRVKTEYFDQLLSIDVPEYSGELGDARLFDSIKTCCAQICDILSKRIGSPEAAFSTAVCRYLDDNMSDPTLSVKMTAEHFGISEPTLQKLIHREKGCSFLDYINKMRFSMAVKLLTDTDLPIAQIAAQCGYNSPNSFYKAFKRMSVVPPTALRQRAKAMDADGGAGKRNGNA